MNRSSSCAIWASVGWYSSSAGPTARTCPSVSTSTTYGVTVERPSCQSNPDTTTSASPRQPNAIQRQLRACTRAEPIRSSQTCAETGRHLKQVKEVGAELGLGFLGVGMWPDKTRAELPIMPKGRYKIMLDHMPRVGSLGLDMMLRTCTVQTNLDYASEADLVQKSRV